MASAFAPAVAPSAKAKKATKKKAAPPADVAAPPAKAAPLASAFAPAVATGGGTATYEKGDVVVNRTATYLSWLSVNAEEYDKGTKDGKTSIVQVSLCYCI